MTEFQSPADDRLAVALKRAAETGGLLASPVPAGQLSARGARRRRRTYAAGAALAVCLVSGGAAVAALQLGRGDEPVGPAVPPSPTRSASLPESSSFADRSPSPGVEDSLPPTRTQTGTPSRTPPGTPTGTGTGMPSRMPSASLPPDSATPTTPPTPSGS
ncbi:hypothetical protein AB0N81_34105 [Streptomyces sp. NPDC093510]|uniref:hypothetical protein n=1 Tax=Streptomyces sp. NPDC093510 TaxID=3155199 RepID=UPI003421E1CC